MGDGEMGVTQSERERDPGRVALCATAQTEGVGDFSMP